MWPFKKKKLYRVVWKHGLTGEFAEYVKATDVADAWKRITKEHWPLILSCISIEEV